MKKIKLKAVALSFDSELNKAPEIIAKGEGSFAEKIINTALKENVNVVKDPDLAEILHEIPAGSEIPDSLYRTVAVIYSFLYDLNKKQEK